MRADSRTHDAIVELITETYRRMSTPGSDPAALMSHPDFAVAGSGLGELAYDHEMVKGMADAVSSWGFAWTVQDVTVWQQGDVAWAQILGSVRTRRDGIESEVPYWNTGVFARGDDGSWAWRYWGGAEPQAEPRV
jgi:ketosteroid isomerase-like protein